MQEENMRDEQKSMPVSTMERPDIDSSKLAEEMPEDPGSLNICLSCE